jgi:hypothetical protein
VVKCHEILSRFVMADMQILTFLGGGGDYMKC